jgi:hypothetical protein
MSEGFEFDFIAAAEREAANLGQEGTQLETEAMPDVTAPAPVTEEKIQKTARVNARMKFHQILDPKGGIYQLSQTIEESVGAGKDKDPLRFVQRILGDVKRWSMGVNQRYEHQYFLETLRRLGKDTKVTHFMGRLRQLHSKEMEEPEFVAGCVIQAPPQPIDQPTKGTRIREKNKRGQPKKRSAGDGPGLAIESEGTAGALEVTRNRMNKKRA